VNVLLLAGVATLLPLALLWGLRRVARHIQRRAAGDGCDHDAAAAVRLASLVSLEAAASGRRDMMRAHEAWQRFWRERDRNVDVATVMRRVSIDGALSARFVFLTLVSCGVATLGLLLDSTPVVIGAMLMAPLLGPITQLGVALARADMPMAARGAATLLVGTGCALALSALLAGLAPAEAVTREILARTQPNLLDLTVALLSGLAGGYALVRAEASVFAGVAIATALMPPLAACGWGVAHADIAIASGAALLFLGNAVGIAIGIAVTSTWYGLHAPGRMRARLLVVTALLASVSVPLSTRIGA